MNIQDRPSLIICELSEGNISEIYLSSTREERRKMQNTVSKYPVQKGFMVSDHLIRQNTVLTLNSNLSNSSISVSPRGVNQAKQSYEASKVVAETQTFATTPEAETVGSVQRQTNVESYDFILQDIMDKGVLCTVVTVLKIYNNMALVDYEINSSPDNLSTPTVSLTFEEIRIKEQSAALTTRQAVEDVSDQNQVQQGVDTP